MRGMAALIVLVGSALVLWMLASAPAGAIFAAPTPLPTIAPTPTPIPTLAAPPARLSVPMTAERVSEQRRLVALIASGIVIVAALFLLGLYAYHRSSCIYRAVTILPGDALYLDELTAQGGYVRESDNQPVLHGLIAPPLTITQVRYAFGDWQRIDGGR